jgi:hypothetical protein
MMRLTAWRHCRGNGKGKGKGNGMMPSISSIKPNAIIHATVITPVTTRPHYFLPLAVPELLRYLKNSELGSTTITSLWLLKLAR